LKNGAGFAFMTRYDNRADLAPRDIVARAIDQEMKESGAPYVYLDITQRSPEELTSRFPNIYAHLQDSGLNMATDRIPVVPAAHYLCGGVKCGLDGTTDIEGLLVSGEVACTGMHGANRLASNSLLEAVVISRRASERLRNDMSEEPTSVDFPPLSDSGGRLPGVLVAHLKRDARQIMWDYVGIVRSNQRLDWARRSLARLRGEVDLLQSDAASTYEIVELQNILTCAQLMVESAGIRRESRGLHYNTDAPVASDLKPGEDTVLCRTDNNVTA
jgi:L-aspartate oxidase